MIVVDSASQNVPAPGSAFCIAVDITEHPGDVVLMHIPTDAWVALAKMPFYKDLEDQDIKLFDTSVGFSRGRNIDGGPVTEFFSGEEVFTYTVSGLNFWMDTTIEKELFAVGNDKFGLRIYVKAVGEAGLSVTNPFTNYGGLFSKAWEAYVEGEISLNIELTLFGKTAKWRFAAKGAVMASLDGDTGTKPPDRDLCGPVQNPKGFFITVQLSMASSGFGNSLLDSYIGKFLLVGLGGETIPVQYYGLYRSEPQGDGSYVEGVEGFGFRFKVAEWVCLFPGLCFRVYFDMAYSDRDVLARCDIFKQLYADLPDGKALSLRGTAVPKKLFGLVTLDARAEFRLVLSSRKFAFIAQVKVLLSVFGVSVEASLAVGNYPQIFYAIGARVRIFNIFEAQLDIIGKLPRFDSKTLIDWGSMSLIIRGRFIGDIMEAIGKAVERVLNQWADAAVKRFDDIKRALDWIKDKLDDLRAVFDKLKALVEKARALFEKAKKVSDDGQLKGSTFGIKPKRSVFPLIEIDLIESANHDTHSTTPPSPSTFPGPYPRRSKASKIK